jgi:diadenylate cyclase
LEDTLAQFRSLLSQQPDKILINVVDILLVAYLIYRLLMLVRGTQAWRIFAGILSFLFVFWLSGRLGLYTLYWLLEKAIYLGPTALVLLFFPELRAAIEGLAPNNAFWKRLVPTNVEERVEARTVEAIVAAVAEMSGDRVGALIVIEKRLNLDEYASNGVLLNARVSSALLESIFFENNPLHDGAVIMRGDMILAAASRLPLSESNMIDPHVHMRHRAAVGISEVSDCMAIVVSEERGSISVASEGKLTRLSGHAELRTILNSELRSIDDAKPVVTRSKVKRKRPKEAN